MIEISLLVCISNTQTNLFYVDTEFIYLFNDLFSQIWSEKRKSKDKIKNPTVR